MRYNVLRNSVWQAKPSQMRNLIKKLPRDIQPLYMLKIIDTCSRGNVREEFHQRLKEFAKKL